MGTKDAGAIQRAIDSCAKGNGGAVHFATGTYVSGPLDWKSHVPRIARSCSPSLKRSARRALPGIEKSPFEAESVSVLRSGLMGTVLSRSSAFLHLPFAWTRSMRQRFRLHCWSRRPRSQSNSDLEFCKDQGVLTKSGTICRPRQ